MSPSLPVLRLAGWVVQVPRLTALLSPSGPPRPSPGHPGLLLTTQALPWPPSPKRLHPPLTHGEVQQVQPQHARGGNRVTPLLTSGGNRPCGPLIISQSLNRVPRTTDNPGPVS